MIFERSLRRELTSTAGAVLTTLFTITITTMVIRILGQAAGGKVASQDVIELIGFEAIRQLPVILILTTVCFQYLYFYCPCLFCFYLQKI